MKQLASSFHRGLSSNSVGSSLCALLMHEQLQNYSFFFIFQKNFPKILSCILSCMIFRGDYIHILKVITLYLQHDAVAHNYLYSLCYFSCSNLSSLSETSFSSLMSGRQYSFHAVPRKASSLAVSVMGPLTTVST